MEIWRSKRWFLANFSLKSAENATKPLKIKRNREKTTEKKFSEGAPKIIKIGKDNNNNFKNVSILIVAEDIIF